MKQQHDACVLYAYMVLSVFPFSYMCQHLLNQLILIQILLIVRIPPLFYTYTSESLQTSYDRYICIGINKNGLQLLKNMFRICFPYGIWEHISYIRNIS